MDKIEKITNALDQGLKSGKISAYSKGGKILLMIQDAPDELRRLADTMEKIGVSEIKAFVELDRPNVAGLTVKKLKELAEGGSKSSAGSATDSDIIEPDSV